ncbi:MAG: hypothetical protein JST63_17680 [Bacteroidetes bacterium]|nr:hypothetical protein [Bacteroidota bacterium]
MKSILSVILSSLLILGCHNSKEKTDTTEGIAIKDTSHHVEMTDIIEMDNGQKWKINLEMKPFIAEEENILKSYTESHSNDFKNLAVQLKEKNSALIKSCTMKGKSHEELHKWLHPHLERVAALEKADNEQQANDLVHQLMKSFQTFHEYFQ